MIRPIPRIPSIARESLSALLLLLATSGFFSGIARGLAFFCEGGGNVKPILSGYTIPNLVTARMTVDQARPRDVKYA